MDQSKKKNPHEGHREKLKRRFQNEGLEHFEDHNILELILFYAIPRRDTNDIAHALLDRFGSLSRVFEADVKELCRVPGIGEHAAYLIKTYPAVAKRYYTDRFGRGKRLPEYEEMGQELVLHFAGLGNEEVYAVFYDNSLTMCGTQVVHEGDINSVSFSFRRLCDSLVLNKASYVVVAHNHPHGLPIASSEDLNTTTALKNFLLQMNVILLDHFIIAEKRYSSIQKENYRYIYDSVFKNLSEFPDEKDTDFE